MVGNPADGVRDLPDVALFASAGSWNSVYVYCFSDAINGGAVCNGQPPYNWSLAGGTSFAAPIMAGIQALVNQKLGANQGNPNAGVAYELDAIAAVVIGGTRLSGGKGSISGTIVGTLIIGVLTNMLRLNNVDSNVEMMIKAVIIVLAVAVQRERIG